MGRLIIVAGAGGAGKSFFLKKWAELDERAVRIKKYVSGDREPRKIEIQTGESDLIFDRKYDPRTPSGKIWRDRLIKKYPELEAIRFESVLNFHDREFTASRVNNNGAIYKYSSSYYEVDVDGIEIALKQGKNPIVIVRKSSAIHHLVETYPDALIIYVQSILSGKDLVDRLVALGESKEDAKKRQGRNLQDLNDYIESIQKLPRNPRVVINDFDERENGAVSTQIQDIYNDEIRDYSFKAKSIFVIRSYGDNNINAFTIAKKAARNVFGRDDTVYEANNRQDGSYMINDHVIEAIDSRDCIICDITNDRCTDCEKTEMVGEQSIRKQRRQGTSANVWFELGYAYKSLRSRGVDISKRLILISKEGSEMTIVPVDLGGSAVKIVKYKEKYDLLEALETQLRNIYNL